MKMIKVLISIVLLIFYIMVEETYAVNTDKRSPEACLASLRVQFGFPGNVAVKTAEECYEFAYKKLKQLELQDTYGQYYYGYLHKMIPGKDEIYYPKKFCDIEHFANRENCKRELLGSGFTQPRGQVAFNFAYTSTKESEFTNEDGYPRKYLKYMFDAAKLPEGTQNPQQWCDTMSYKTKTRIKLVTPELLEKRRRQYAEKTSRKQGRFMEYPEYPVADSSEEFTE